MPFQTLECVHIIYLKNEKNSSASEFIVVGKGQAVLLTTATEKIEYCSVLKRNEQFSHDVLAHHVPHTEGQVSVWSPRSATPA